MSRTETNKAFKKLMDSFESAPCQKMSKVDFEAYRKAVEAECMAMIHGKKASV